MKKKRSCTLKSPCVATQLQEAVRLTHTLEAEMRQRWLGAGCGGWRCCHTLHLTSCNCVKKWKKNKGGHVFGEGLHAVH